ncbi:hypothetical protein [Nonomuraea longicatena]|uniref:Uncharacterized protein n=1 Tax=Nonomuraea longicatena TaxID=83682 RepID=A0ABP4ADA5_9ACTN
MRVAEIQAFHTRAEAGWRAEAVPGGQAVERVAPVYGSTVLQCQGEVMRRVGEIADRIGRPCQTPHLLDGDAAAFAEAYQAEAGFDRGWSPL